MESSLSNMERRLKEWIEKNTDRISGKTMLNAIAQSIVACMMAHLVTTSDSKYLAPSQYVVRRNPEDQMSTENHDELLTKLRLALQQVAVEYEIVLAHDLVIEIKPDPSIKPHEYIVDVSDKENLEKTARIEIPSTKIVEEQPLRKSSRFCLKINDEEFFFLEQLTTNIGRYPDNQLVISDPRISRHHAQLRKTENRFVLSDLDSTGGTFVNGEQIKQQEIKPGDILSLAGFPLLFMEIIQTQNNPASD